MKPAVFKLPRMPQPKIDRINHFKGINVSVDPTQLEYNESPDMLNMTLDTEGALDKRTGYAKLFPTALGGTVWSAFDYRKSDGTTEHLLHAGTKLYRMAIDGTQPVEYKINNLLGTDGSCEDTSKFTHTGGTAALDSSRKTQGGNSIKITKNAAVSTVEVLPAKYIYPVVGDFYLAISDVYLENTCTQFVITRTSSGVTLTNKYPSAGIGGYVAGTTGQFMPMIVAWQVTAVTTPGTSYFSPKISHNGTSGHDFNVDAFRVYKITQAEFDALGASVDIVTARTIAARYPYMEPGNISSLANARSNMFSMSGKVYIQDGTNYLEYDGVNLVDPEPYIPTLFISTPPTGGGEAFEDFNLLGTKFKQSFSGDGTATVFQLALSGLDATLVTALVGTTTINEGSGLTVDRTLGKVTFTTAPATGTPNNVVITASRTVAGMKQKITACKNARLYGGTNDTRVFMWSKNILYRSDVYRPNYFPENAFQKVGGDDDIQNMVIQYDTAVIIKESSLWSMRYEQDANGMAVFPTRPVNDSVGSIAPYSVQIVDNNPTWLSKEGIKVLAGGTVRDERNVQHLSKRIDRLLLNNTLKDALTIDFDQKYMVFLGVNVYVWDYHLNEWYPWDNITATCVFQLDGTLYFGTSQGLIYRFKKATEYNAYNDDGQVIDAYWRSKVTSFGSDEHQKMVEKVFFSLKPWRRSSADLSYATNQTESGTTTPVQISARVDLLDFTDIQFDHMSFMTSSLPQEGVAKVKAKKVIYFQSLLQNNRLDESMGILSIGMKYQTQKEVTK